LITEQIDAASAQVFRDCYRIRSKIAHGGRSPDADSLVREANRLEPIVKTLVLQKLTGIPGPS
jgi:hypothetical protein